MRKRQYQLTFLVFLMVAPMGGVCGFARTIDQQAAAKTANKRSKRRATQPAGRQSRSLAPVNPPASTGAQAGPYYALLIGNNNYKYVNKLLTAIGDADAVAKTLHERYGFMTTVLHDATRDQVFTALTDYRHKLPQESSLVIYYAGHGILDREADQAYWLPVDAQADNPEHWISADDITSEVRAIPSLHILIISDSCYSGALMRSVDPSIDPQETAAYIRKMLASKSRNLMSSGGVEPVADGGPENHSIFAVALLESLAAIAEEQFSAADLFQKFIKRGVAGRSRQVPEYSFIRNSGDEFGDFVFSRTGAGKRLDGEGGRPAIRTSSETNDAGLRTDGPAPDSKASGPGESSATWENDEAIKDLLRRYQDAYNQKDAGALWQIWPNPAKKTKEDIDNAFRTANSINMTVTASPADISPDGQNAQVQGQFSEHFTPKDGRPEPVRNGDITFVLKKAKGAWTIAEVK